MIISFSSHRKLIYQLWPIFGQFFQMQRDWFLFSQSTDLVMTCLFTIIICSSETLWILIWTLIPHTAFKICVVCVVSSSHDREGDGTPLQHSCLENPRDGGPWGAAVIGSHRVGHNWIDLAAAAAAAHMNLSSLIFYQPSTLRFSHSQTATLLCMHGLHKSCSLCLECFSLLYSSSGHYYSFFVFC